MLSPLLISILASIAAFAGGAIALRFRDKLHIILGLSAGAVLGAALFDLIPEAVEIGGGVYSVGEVLALTAIGFFVYLVIDRTFSLHAHHNHDHDADDHAAEARSSGGSLGAASFCLHSLIDGVAIGLAFQASSIIGAVVAIAIVAHRFSDGINTVGVILKHRGINASVRGWLTAVAIAPIVGTLLTFVFSVSSSTLSVILALFAGFFLYIGASDLIPEGHHSHSKIMTTIMTILGALVLYLIVSVA